MTHPHMQLGDHHMRNLTIVRGLGWIATAALVCAAFVTPAATLANTGNQSGDDIAWNDPSFQGSDAECEGLDLDEGQVFWHFVQTQVSGGTASGRLTTVFDDAGTIVTTSYRKTGGTLHWGVITGEDVLERFSSEVTSPGQLNLSHICSNPSEGTPQPTDAPTLAPTEAPTLAPTIAPTLAPTNAPTLAPTEAPTLAPTIAPTVAPTEAPTEAPTLAPTIAPTIAPTVAPTLEPESTPSLAATETPAGTPTGEVLGATGAPEVTPPSTDTAIAAPAGTTSSGWTPLLLIAAGVLALSLVLTPAPRRTKR
jgi:hypothetical protein